MLSVSSTATITSGKGVSKLGIICVNVLGKVVCALTRTEYTFSTGNLTIPDLVVLVLSFHPI
jgi:hypothetical protein